MKYFLYCRKSTEDEERQVLSLQSQREAVDRAFLGKDEVEIVDVFEESKSAKKPGRSVFATMLERIEAGEADGIISWAPDRLARNSVDGGRVIYLLDTGVLRDLKFATYTFENNSQGKFMLSIMFGQSKYYSDALSENVKRGNATKIAMGWRPNRAPLGYRNCPETKTTIPDPDQFPIIRHIFDLFLTGAYTPHQIVKIAQNNWGHFTPRNKRSGGRPLGRSSIYQTLSNPFYKGVIVWGGATYPGRHQPMVTAEEFDRVQALLSNRSTPRLQRQSFVYSGTLACGRCGRAVTAERKTNRYGRHYTYYHCAARGRLNRGCGEPSVEEGNLNLQFKAFLASLGITRQLAAWARKRLKTDLLEAQEKATQFAAARLSAIAEIASQLRELTSLRLRRMVTDEEFTQERERLEKSRSSLERAENPTFNDQMFELLDIIGRISKYALDWFSTAPNDQKQALIKMLCSNPSLIGKKLSVEAVKPFMTSPEFAGCPRLLGVEDEDRTFAHANKRFLRAIDELSADGMLEERLQELRELERMFLPADLSIKVRAHRADAGHTRGPQRGRSSRRNQPGMP
jgi:DNA invertase Pin-like site-specific DNA recombinase